MAKLRKFAFFPFNCTDSLEIIMYGDEPGNIMNSVFSWHDQHRANPGLYIHTTVECMWNYHVQMHIHLHAILPFNVCMWVCICKCVCTYVCMWVCVLRSVPLCFASVQKGLVPTTWCRAASAPPIPAWIATLAANQKLPAAFAVCPLSIFSNTSLNLLASLGCCIKTPHSTHSQITSFLGLC